MNDFWLVSNISILPVFLTRTSPLIQKINLVGKMVALQDGNEGGENIYCHRKREI